jgi:plasmid stabilization system protein ParE
MPTLTDVEPQAMQLSQADRAKLATHLLDTLPIVLADEDEGVAEALSRDSELDRDPKAGMTLEEFRQATR